MLRGVRYHDGVLESLEFVAGDQVTLKIRATSAELLTVKAIGLTDVFVELWAGNIILDIFIWRLDEVPPLWGDATRRLFCLDVLSSLVVGLDLEEWTVYPTVEGLGVSLVSLDPN